MIFLCQDKWQPLLNTVTGVHKYKWLKQNVQGLPPQSALLSTIAEFALKEEPVDVEKMRKCLLKQVSVAPRILCARVWGRRCDPRGARLGLAGCVAVGASRGSPGRDRFHPEAGHQELPASVGAARHVLWLAETHSRRHRDRVRLGAFVPPLGRL